LFAILNMMPNLQQLMIPKLKKKFAHVYAYTPVLEKLWKLKYVRIFLGSNGKFNEAFLEFLMSSAPALSHLELQNLSISADPNLANIAALLQKLPSITLKFKDDEDEDVDDALPVLKNHNLKIKQLSMSSASTSMSGFKQLFLASFDSLETLDIYLRPEPNSFKLTRFFPPMPNLINISFRFWPEAHSNVVTLIATFETETFPNLAKVTISSPKFAPIHMRRMLHKVKILRNLYVLKIFHIFLEHRSWHKANSYRSRFDLLRLREEALGCCGR